VAWPESLSTLVPGWQYTEPTSPSPFPLFPSNGSPCSNACLLKTTLRYRLYISDTHRMVRPECLKADGHEISHFFFKKFKPLLHVSCYILSNRYSNVTLKMFFQRGVWYEAFFVIFLTVLSINTAGRVPKSK
jgi:hypothetical protein